MRSITSMTNTQTILDSIENRLRELNHEIETLSAARSALDGSEATSAPRRRRSAGAPRTRGSTETAATPTATTTPTATATATKPSTGRRASRPRRSKNGKAPEVIPAGRLELLLSQDGGLTTTALAERTNGDRDQVLTLLRELEAAGRIRRTGQRRSTRWHAITDEDRIRERAAELAARRKQTA